MERINLKTVHEEFLHELFGADIPEGEDFKASRDDYTKAMHVIQERHGLKQGHPDFPAWLMTLLIRSPFIIGDSEELDYDEDNEGE